MFDLLEDYGDRVPVTDYGWENYIWKSDRFSWAHLEKYCTDKVSVLHCVVMPYTDTNAPIFGFDVIEINGNLTGMFLDITPVDNMAAPTIPSVGEPRPVPDWADFFSPEFVCCKPGYKDLSLGIYLLNYYLEFEVPGVVSGDYAPGQQRYIDGQRNNPQTFKMLKSDIGEDKAKDFINNVLFPNRMVTHPVSNS